jgi:UDP-glucose 4-epimerase
MRILVTGGAGYVGSHAVRHLLAAGHEVWVYDNCGRGHRDAVPEGLLIEGSLADRGRLTELMSVQRVEAVMHFAAFALVGESVAEPAMYYENNVGGSLALLDAMREAAVRRIVFSSTTAVYGSPERIPIGEETPLRPINPYGFTKMVVEQALEDYRQAYGLGYAALRYFNAAGAHPGGRDGRRP